MTAVQAIEALLDTNWTESITGRSTDVPKPTFDLQQSNLKRSLRTRDSCNVEDGGDTDIEPLGIGWTHEATTSRVSIDLRTADRSIDGIKVNGRERLFGSRPGIASSDRYSGLSGEVKRILDTHRKGFAEFDLVVLSPFRDISGQTGQNHYRAVADVTLYQVADEINPDPTA